MAIIVNNGNQDWDDAWLTTSKADTKHASTLVSVASDHTIYSTTWNGNSANTDVGVVVYMSADSNTGTITMTLERDTGGGSWAAQVTSTHTFDSTSWHGSYYFFVYSSTHAETDGTNNYRLKATGSSSSHTDFGSNSSSTTNIYMVQVLAATAAMNVADNVYICGQCNGTTGNPTAKTVDVDINDSTNAWCTGGLNIMNGGNLVYATAASGTYYLKLDGQVGQYPGSVFSMGTEAVPVDASSTATLDWATTSERVWAINANATFNAWGGRQFTNDIWRCYTTTEISDTTNRTVTMDEDVEAEGWAAGDIISVQGTIGWGQTERLVIDSVDGNDITISTDWAYKHSINAEIFNMSRNVTFQKTGASYCRLYNNGYYNTGWVYHTGLHTGTSSCGALQMGGDQYGSGQIQGVNIQFCSYDQCGLNSSNGTIRVSSTYTTAANFSITDVCFYKTYVSIMFSYLTNSIINISNVSSAYVVNGGSHFWSGSYAGWGVITMTNCNIYDSLATTGNTRGFGQYYGQYSVIMNNCKLWGYPSYGMQVGGWVEMNNCILGGDGVNTIPNGIEIRQDSLTEMHWKANNCKFLSNPLSGLDFNGTTSTVTVANDSSNNAIYGATAFSVEWKGRVFAAGESSQRLFDKVGGSTSAGWRLYLDSSRRIGWSIGETTHKTCLTTDTFPYLMTVHIVVTWASGSAAKIYMNGALCSLGTTTACTTPSNDTSIGLSIGNTSASTANTFDGQMYRARIYRDVELTAAQVWTLATGGTVAGATGEYLFTENTGTDIADTGTGDNHGTAANCVWCSDNGFKERIYRVSKLLPYSTLCTIQTHNDGQIADRDVTSLIHGDIGDQVALGKTTAWAYSGSKCVLMHPLSTSVPLEFIFYIPVIASQAFTLKAYVKKSAGSPTLACTIYDNLTTDDGTTKLLDAEAVSLTTSWALYTATSKTPTNTGFCKVVFAALDNASTGEIGIDDLQVGNKVCRFDKWADGFPSLDWTQSGVGVM